MNARPDPVLSPRLQGLRDYLNTSPETQAVRDANPNGEYKIVPLVAPENRAAYREGVLGSQHGHGNATDVKIMLPNGDRLSDEHLGATLINNSGAFDEGRIGSYVNSVGAVRYHMDSLDNQLDNQASRYWINNPGTDKLNYFSNSQDWLNKIQSRSNSQ